MVPSRTSTKYSTPSVRSRSPSCAPGASSEMIGTMATSSALTSGYIRRSFAARSIARRSPARAIVGSRSAFMPSRSPRPTSRKRAKRWRRPVLMSLRPFSTSERKDVERPVPRTRRPASTRAPCAGRGASPLGTAGALPCCRRAHAPRADARVGMRTGNYHQTTPTLSRPSPLQIGATSHCSAATNSRLMGRDASLWLRSHPGRRSDLAATVILRWCCPASRPGLSLPRAESRRRGPDRPHGGPVRSVGSARNAGRSARLPASTRTIRPGSFVGLSGPSARRGRRRPRATSAPPTTCAYSDLRTEWYRALEQTVERGQSATARLLVAASSMRNTPLPFGAVALALPILTMRPRARLRAERVRVEPLQLRPCRPSWVVTVTNKGLATSRRAPDSVSDPRSQGAISGPRTAGPPAGR